MRSKSGVHGTSAWHAILLGLLAPACQASRVPADATTLDATTLDADLDAASDDAASACTTLFGSPVARTGLTSEQCRPSCGCGPDAWTAPAWPDDRVAALRTWTLLDPPAEITSDPYQSPPAPGNGVCAVDVVDLAARTYRLHTYASRGEAEAAGAIVTHADPCGVCSTLADLAVYASMPDLGGSVRTCGVRSSDLAGDIACLQTLGFTLPCAQIWAYNTSYTRENCLDVCVANLSAPYNLPDGALNDCLACDETMSGPVFKAVAGRTRRNTGIPNAICRPCSEVVRLEHEYPQ